MYVIAEAEMESTLEQQWPLTAEQEEKAIKQLGQAMYVLAKVAKLYYKHGLASDGEQAFIPIERDKKRPIKGGGTVPRSTWRKLEGKSVEQIKHAVTICPKCHLPMNKPMKIGGIEQRCKCKKVKVSA